MHIPTILPSMFPLHSPHSQGYYWCNGAWPPVLGNGLLPFPQPNRFVFLGPSGFGLSSSRLPVVSLPYPSFQHFPIVLAASQIPSLIHEANDVKFGSLPLLLSIQNIVLSFRLIFKLKKNHSSERHHGIEWHLMTIQHQKGSWKYVVKS